MHKIHYRPGKAAISGLLLLLVAAWLGWGWLTDADANFISLALALLSAGAAAKLIMDAMSQTPALVIEPTGLQVRRTWGQVAMVPWGEVQALNIEVRTVRYYGIIPVAKQETLVIKCDGGLFGAQRFRLSVKMLDLPAGGAGQLMALLHAAHVRAVGEAGVMMAGAGRHGWGSRSVPTLRDEAASEGGFDPDAALARYLSQKGVGDAVVGAPAPLPPRAAPVSPARPAFGRKSSTL